MTDNFEKAEELFVNFKDVLDVLNVEDVAVIYDELKTMLRDGEEGEVVKIETQDMGVLYNYFVLCNFPQCCINDFYADSLEEIVAHVNSKDEYNFDSAKNIFGFNLIYDIGQIVKLSLDRCEYLHEPKIIILDRHNERLIPNYDSLDTKEIEKHLRLHNKNILDKIGEEELKILSKKLKSIDLSIDKIPN